MAKSSSKPNAKKSVGRYVSPEVRGRVTKARPRGYDHSPRWYGALVLALLVVGVLVIVLNYLGVLPGSTSAWWLVGGLVTMFVGFFLATQYK
jgi:hypothetical protein